MKPKERWNLNKRKRNHFFEKKTINHYIKDPVHKEINFADEKWLLEFAYSFEMIRLLEIRQLGIGYKIFPSATHNRYSHCLGAYAVAKKFTKHFMNHISKDDSKLFLLAALLHDIGHGPYSHVFEKISHIHHEELGKRIIQNPKLGILKLLKKNNINANTLTSIYTGECKQEWIGRLISSNLDVDRIDYLLRDSYSVGTKFSTIDIDFLVERSIIMDNDVFFQKSAVNYIESFLLGRHYMYEDIYDNKNTYIFEWTLMKIFDRLKEIKQLFFEKKDKIYFYDFYEWIVFEKDVNVHKTYIYLNDGNLNSFIWSLRCLNDFILNSFINSFLNNSVNVDAKNYSQDLEKHIKELSQKKNIDSKYLYSIQEKKKKDIFLLEDKNAINIYDRDKNLSYKFPSERIMAFNQTTRRENNKIILINKTLIY